MAWRRRLDGGGAACDRRVLSRGSPHSFEVRNTATVAVGHSLGEFTALHWAGSLDESSLLRIARARGRAMAEVDGPTGAMLSVAADKQAVEQILNGERVVIAGLNSPTQTVLSGEATEINVVARRAEAHGLRATPLRVSHAFHSLLVASAGARLSAHLNHEEFGPLQRMSLFNRNGPSPQRRYRLACLAPRAGNFARPLHGGG